MFFELYDEDTGGWRPGSLAERLGVCKPARGSGSWCFDVPDVTAPLLQEPVIVQELPEVLVTSSLVRAAQPADVEQVLDVPVLHMIEDDSILLEFLDLASFQEIPKVQVSSSGALGVLEQVTVQSLPAVQQRTVAQVVDVHVPPGPDSVNFVEQVVGVPGRASSSWSCV